MKDLKKMRSSKTEASINLTKEFIQSYEEVVVYYGKDLPIEIGVSLERRVDIVELREAKRWLKEEREEKNQKY